MQQPKICGLAFKKTQLVIPTMPFQHYVEFKQQPMIDLKNLEDVIGQVGATDMYVLC